MKHLPSNVANGRATLRRVSGSFSCHGSLKERSRHMCLAIPFYGRGSSGDAGLPLALHWGSWRTQHKWRCLHTSTGGHFTRLKIRYLVLKAKDVVIATPQHDTAVGLHGRNTVWTPYLIRRALSIKDVVPRFVELEWRHRCSAKGRPVPSPRLRG